MDLDSCLQVTGGFGRFQKLLFLLFLSLIMFFGSFSYWCQIFILLIPDHHCSAPPTWNTLANNLTRTGKCQLALESPTEQKAQQMYAVQEPWMSYDGWSKYFTSSYEVEGLPMMNTDCKHGWEYDLEVLYPTIASQNNWVCDDEWKVFFSHTIYWLGSTVGFFLNGFFLDRFGRWKVVFALICVQTLATVSTIFSSSIFPLFCAVRFLSGLSAMPLQSSSYTLAVEMIMSNKRKLVAVSTAIYWLMAAAVFPWIAISLRDWRLIVAVCMTPGPLLLVLMKFVPESPSWLLSRGETEEAFQVFSYIGRVNLGFETSHLNKIKESAMKSCLPKEKENIFKTTMSLLRTPNMRKKSLLLFVAWFSICLSYHGNNLSQSTAGSNVFLLYSLGSALEMPVCFVHLFTVDRLGRKPPTLVPLLLVAALAPLANLIPQAATWWRFAVSMVVRSLFSLAYNILFQLGCELFPTSLRGRGVFLMRALGDVGTSVAPFIITMSAVWPFLSSVVFSGLSLLCMVLTFGLPETLGQPLPQTVEEAELFGKGQQLLPFTLPCCPRSEARTKLSTTTLVTSPSCLSLSTDGSSVGSAFDDSAISIHL